jgi:membrane-associated phospholipid phosphatase
MAVAASVAERSPLWVGLCSVEMALFVALSRVYLRVHFVSDVVVGLGLGVGGAALGWMIVPG